MGGTSIQDLYNEEILRGNNNYPQQITPEQLAYIQQMQQQQLQQQQVQQYQPETEENELDDILNKINKEEIKKSKKKRKTNKNKCEDNKKLVDYLKEGSLLLVIYILMSNSSVKRFIKTKLPQINKDNSGKISLIGLVIYGSIMTSLFLVSRKYLLD